MELLFVLMTSNFNMESCIRDVELICRVFETETCDAKTHCEYLKRKEEQQDDHKN